MKQTTPSKRTALKANVNAYMVNAIDCSGYAVQGVGINGNIAELPVICETNQQKVNFNTL